MAASNNESYIDIDQHNLDTEVLRQPGLFKKAAEELAEAAADCDEAKAQLELVEAELDYLIRKRPMRYGIEDVKEKAVASAILRDDRYKQALQKYQQAKRRSALRKVEVDALDHRKKAIECAITLFCQDYWSEPRVRREARSKAREAQSNRFYERTKIGKRRED